MTTKPNKPKSAYMFWLDNVCERMKAENPTVRVSNIVEEGQKLWHSMEDKSVWEEKAVKAKAEYEKELEAYNAKIGDGPSNSLREHHNSNDGTADSDDLVWEEKAVKAKAQYEKELEACNAKIGDGQSNSIHEQGDSRVFKGGIGHSDKPKRPMSAYMLWLNSAREQLKAENPGLKVTELAKKGAETWRALKDKHVWEEKAAKAKAQYDKELEAYNAKIGDGPSNSLHEHHDSNDGMDNSYDSMDHSYDSMDYSDDNMGDIQHLDEDKQIIPEELADKPRRPMSAYMLFLNSVREQIKAENPGLKVTEIAKKGEEIWRAMKDKHVWEEKAAKAKAQYEKELEAYNAKIGNGPSNSLREHHNSNDGTADSDDLVWEEKAAKAKAQYEKELEACNAKIGDGQSNSIHEQGDSRVFKGGIWHSDKPKRPMSAYMLWLNSAREQLKAENPGLKVTELAKKGGETWRALKDKHVWEEKAAKAKAQYEKDLEAYNAKIGDGPSNSLHEHHNSNDGTDDSDDSMDDIKSTCAIPKELTDKPKRPMSAYFVWFSNAREQIKAENPELKVTEIAKKAGQIWSSLKDKHVWQEKAAKAMAQYEKELEAYNAKIGAGPSNSLCEHHDGMDDSYDSMDYSYDVDYSSDSTDYSGDSTDYSDDNTGDIQRTAG